MTILCETCGATHGADGVICEFYADSFYCESCAPEIFYRCIVDVRHAVGSECRCVPFGSDILAYWSGRTFALAAGYSTPMAEDFAEWFATFGRWDVAAEFDAYVPADN